MLTRRQARARVRAAVAAAEVPVSPSETSEQQPEQKQASRTSRTPTTRSGRAAKRSAAAAKRDAAAGPDHPVEPKQSKKSSKEDKKEAVELPSTTIDAISDLTLVNVFSLLGLEDLVHVSQVCSRWRALCESRRLWSSVDLLAPPAISSPFSMSSSSDMSEDVSDSYDTDDDEGKREAFVAAVRSLRRAAGVARYTELQVSLGGYASSFKADFSDNANHLKLIVPCALLALQCLRELCKPDVRLLQFDDLYARLTEFEAFIVWETIASKKNLTTLKFFLSRSSRILSSSFRWEERSALSSLTVSLSGGAPWATSPRRPLEHCVRVHCDQLRSVHLPNEEVEGLLDLCPSSLRTLEAPLGQSMLDLLRRSLLLNRLFLSGDKTRHVQGANLAILAEALSLPNVQAGISFLNIKLRDENVITDACLPALEQALGSVSRCGSLTQVRLAGFSMLLTHEGRGPAALAALMAGLPALRSLRLDVSPCHPYVLQALAPRDDGTTVVPECFRLLMLAGRCGLKRGWPSTLRGLMEARPGLHAVVEFGPHLCLRGQGLEAGRFIVLPHLATAINDEGCPAPAFTSKNFKSVFINDLCKVSS